MSRSEEFREPSSLFQSSAKPFRCNHCSFQSNNKLILIQHVFEAHGSDNGSFFYTCVVPSCIHRFKSGSTYSGFLTHCMRKHPGWREALRNDECHTSSLSSTSSTGSMSEGTDVLSDEDMVIEDLGYANESADNNGCRDERTVNIDVMGAQFLLNLKEKYKVTQVALDFVLNAVVKFISIASAEIKHKVFDKLKELNGESDLEDLNDCFLPINPFSQLRTEYEQTKFYKEQLGLIVSYIIVFKFAIDYFYCRNL